MNILNILRCFFSSAFCVMGPVLVSRPRRQAVATMHQNSPLVSLFTIPADVIILNNNALELQHSHQTTRSSLNQSVFRVMVDVRRVFVVDDFSSRRQSHCMQRLPSSVYFNHGLFFPP